MATAKPKFNRLVLAHIPGADWDDNSGKTFVALFQERLRSNFGVEAEIFSVRDAIYDTAKKENIFLNPNLIHRSSDEKIRLLRRLAFRQLETRMTADGTDQESSVRVIHTRATSYSTYSKEESLSLEYLREMKPDLLVVVIDDPIDIHHRIPRRADTRKYGRLGIDDIVWWMEYEVSEMEKLAQALACPLFVLPRRQINALVDLLFSSKQPAYASYPMTKADSHLEEKNRGFVEKLKSHFVVFDPACMGTAHIQRRMTDREQIAYRENILKRDEEWFIRVNSRYVIVYLPALAPAHGSQSELAKASELGKTVWVVLEPNYSDERGKLTPFLDRLVDHVFISSLEFQYFLELSEEERSVYGFILDLMWRFKWRGELACLRDNESSPHELEGTARKLLAKLLDELHDKYEGEVARQMLPAVATPRIDNMAQACWDFNRPLWEITAAREAPTTLFAQPPLQQLAARPPAPQRVRESQNELSPNVPTPQLTEPALTDEDVFYATFRSYATGKNGESLFSRLADFLARNDMVVFHDKLEYLRFLKRTLDHHAYKTSFLFSPGHLKTWLEEFRQGQHVGSKL